jgi:hypothetical protein
MSRQIQERSYEQALAWLREHGFEVSEGPMRATLTKRGCRAVVERVGEGKKSSARIAEAPALVLGGEIAKLVDRGYQKVLKTSKLEMGASADHLRSLHEFAEELKEAIGMSSMYNESMGTVSDTYMYDRVRDRDKPAVERPVRPWQR